MSAQRTRLGLVGAGRWGRNYIKTILADEQCELSYVVSRNPKTKDGVPDGCQVIADWDAALEVPVDGVVIATPPQTHVEIASAYINQSIPVLLEKPVSCDVDETTQLFNLVEKSSVFCMVDYIHLFNPYFQKLKQLCQQEPGKIKSIRSISGAPGPVREDVPVLWDWGVHDLSMCLDLLPNTHFNYLEVLSSHSDNLDSVVNDFNCYLDNSHDIPISLHFGNTLPEKVKRFMVEYENYSYLFDDLSDNKLVKKYHGSDTVEVIAVRNRLNPLQNVVSYFAAKIKSGNKITDSLEMSVTIASLLEGIGSRSFLHA